MFDVNNLFAAGTKPPVSTGSIIENVEQIPEVRHSYNVLSYLDVVTGKIMYGKSGEAILSGGLNLCIGVEGIGNSFKTAFIKFVENMVMARYSVTYVPEVKQFDFSTNVSIDYDTELNMDRDRQHSIWVEAAAQSSAFDVTANLTLEHQRATAIAVSPVTSKRTTMTDKSLMSGDQLFTFVKKFSEERYKNKKLPQPTPFLQDGKPLFAIPPAPFVVDSVTEFTSETNDKQLADNDLGDKDTNTYAMNIGRVKSQFFAEMPRVAVRGGIPVLLTAHLGSVINMDPSKPLERKNSFLSPDKKAKGVSDKYYFLTTLALQHSRSAPSLNQDKVPLYPEDSSDNARLETSVMEVTYKVFRNKYGKSGVDLTFLYHQSNGMQVALSEFHYLRKEGRFSKDFIWGFEGNDQNYVCALAPHHKLSRTSIRAKIEANADLRQALAYCAGALAMYQHWDDKEGIIVPPQTLYKDLQEMGYDWKIILSCRDWWTFNNDEHPRKFLSTYELLRMRAGLSIPKWWPQDTHPIDLSKAKLATGIVRITALTPPTMVKIYEDLFNETSAKTA